MFKLVVNAPDGEQAIHLVESSGGYFDNARILWDERVDGPADPVVLASLGGLVRNGSKLEVDANLLSQAQGRAASKTSAEGAKVTRVDQAKQFLRSADFSSAMNAATLTNVCKAIVVILKDVQNKL